MTAEDWKRLAELYSAAMERTRELRPGFITEACGDDEAMKSELQRLLDATEADEGFLDRPLSVIAELLPEIASQSQALQPGDVLCERFEVIRFIASGGMGEVYEAFDRVLGEPAAIKTIRSQIATHQGIVEQFKQEVRRARAIRSEHVCPVYDVFREERPGGPLIFLSMQLLEGETLAERLRREGALPKGEALKVLRDIAKGLDAAHAEGVVHGDLKPGNVMLARAKTGAVAASITDFGLARQAGAPGEPATDSIMRAGTPAYMAPEQLEGAPPARASDIYALGLMAFEMVTGLSPVVLGAKEGAGTRRGGEPVSPRSAPAALPKRWDGVIARCLSAKPEKRYGSAGAFVDALEGPKRGRLGGLVGFVLGLAAVAVAVWLVVRPGPSPPGPSPPANSLAVLAFRLLGEREESNYFSEAFTEELTHTLGSLRNLRVIGPESAFRFKASSLSPEEIGRRLGVRYLLSGSIRRTGAKLRVLIRMIRAPDGVQVWVGEFERDEKGLFELRHEISRDVAGTLGVTLAGMQTANSGATKDLQAQDLYWMGRYYWRQRTDSAVRLSLDYFDEATARDPSFAAGWTGLADAYSVIAERNMIAPAEALEKAAEAAAKAVALAPGLAEGWVSMGQVASLHHRNFVEAERCFRRALQINPRLATAHQWYSYMLVKQRRFTESIDHARRAIAIEPFSLPANINLAVVLYYARLDDEALQQCRKLIEMDPASYTSRLITAQILARRGQTPEAFSEMEKLRENASEHPLVVRFWAELYAIAGRRREADEALTRLIQMRSRGRVPAAYVASVWGMLGNRDKAFEWLEMAYREHDGLVSIVHAAPGFDSIRTDPRYPALLERIGITGGKKPDSVQPQ